MTSTEEVAALVAFLRTRIDEAEHVALALGRAHLDGTVHQQHLDRARAQRVILERYVRAAEAADAFRLGSSPPGSGDPTTDETAALTELLDLGSRYAQHPGYRAEWWPSRPASDLSEEAP